MATLPCNNGKWSLGNYDRSSGQFTYTGSYNTAVEACAAAKLKAWAYDPVKKAYVPYNPAMQLYRVECAAENNSYLIENTYNVAFRHSPLKLTISSAGKQLAPPVKILAGEVITVLADQPVNWSVTGEGSLITNVQRSTTVLTFRAKAKGTVNITAQGKCETKYEQISITSNQPVLTSETDEEPNKSRKTIGVGEGITIKSDRPVTWSVSSNLVTISKQNDRFVHFFAKDQAGSVKIEATAKTGGEKNSMQISVIQPSGLKIEKLALMHIHGLLDAGFKSKYYLLPTQVNFKHVQIREVDSKAQATGSWSYAKGQLHGRYPNGRDSGWVESDGYKAGMGTGIDATDLAYQVLSRFCPFNIQEGNIYYDIPIEWKLNGQQSVHQLVILRQSGEISKSGHVTVKKGNETVTFHYLDPTINHSIIIGGGINPKFRSTC